MPDALLSGLAAKVAAPLAVAAGRRLVTIAAGSEDERAIDAAIRRATAALVSELDPTNDADAVLRLLVDKSVAALLVDAAFRGQPANAELSRVLVDLGYDADTSPIDLVDFAHRLCLRLREEIRREADDSSSVLFNRLLLATIDSLRDISISPTPHLGALPPAPPLLIGRDEDLSRVRTRIVGNRTTVVRGWPGVGKSALTAALLHDSRVVSAFPDGILWAALSLAADPYPELVRWCRELGVPVDPGHSVDDLSRYLTGVLSGRRVLLAIDDVWDVTQGQALLVGGPRCAAVVTTRSTDIAFALASSSDDVYPLGILADSSSLALLEHLAPAVVRSHPDESRALVAELEGLPLALQVAGRLLAVEAALGWGVTQLLDELREGSRLLAAQAPADRVNLVTATTPTVAALLAQSTHRLNSESREQFAFLGAFAEKPATFDVAAIAAVWGTADPRPGIRVLVDRGLLEPVGRGRFTMHALLAMHARTLLERDEPE